ncbi:hypothetical protein N0V88_007391 [Collariella sp. IMI 366227]|nr:hypothetical protein N0V88_007391 [Collariella sp. IMI 366227]
MKHLHHTDGFNSLLGTNYEAREATLAYLASHPQNEIHDHRYRRQQRWMGLPYLARDLRRARFDPVKDVLFLNGLDVEYDALPPDETSALLLPVRLQENATLVPNREKHTRCLDLPEGVFLSMFRNVMMPVYGIIDQARPEGLFDDTMYPDTMGLYPHGKLRDRMFIALVGNYLGRNLQMEDVEFIPDQEVDQVRREGIEAMREPGTGRRRAASVLHRDVLVMTAVWAMWNSIHEQRWKYLASETVKSLREEFRRSLRFARVKTEGRILGREIVHQLSQSKWRMIYAVSRSKKGDYPPNVVHKHIDLQSSPDQMAKDLQGVKVEYVFFAAWLQKDTEEENWQVNGTSPLPSSPNRPILTPAGDMLENFLSALTQTPSMPHLKRILLVCGLKQYGVHFGQAKNPMIESDPWQRDTSLFPPNFYYRQQDLLAAFCEKHHHVNWNVTYPNDVIGFAVGNFMNLASCLGLYAVVARELGAAKEGLQFPGSETYYFKMETFTSSRVHARFCEWVVTEPKAANQAFNVIDGDAQSFQDMWPRLARRFGMRVKKGQFEGSTGLEKRTEMEGNPPITMQLEEAGLQGRVEKSVLEQRVNLVEWSGKEEVKKAWARLAEREGLQKEAFEKATWWFADWVLGRNYDVVASMSKAREAGWTGYHDTWKSFSDVFGEMEALNVLPKVH